MEAIIEAVVTCLAFLFIFTILALPFAAYFRDKKLYQQTSYYRVTRNPYNYVRYNKGAAGEYKIFAALGQYEQSGGKFLFNIYLPRGDAKTTEIDLVLITRKGLFVFESKNFDGWIFGNEAHQNWTQSLPNRRGGSYKNSFYNPVKQNAAHIRHIRQITGYDIPVHSIIVFSDHCTLKKVTLHSYDVRVINLRNLTQVMGELIGQVPDCLSEEAVSGIYNTLLPYANADHSLKQAHVGAIRKV